MQNRNRMITLAFFAAMIAAVMFFLNGTTFHTVSNIESDFLQRLSEKDKGSIAKEFVYSNSKTLFFENQEEQQIVATYIKSIYSNKWKLYCLLQLAKGEKAQVFIDDHVFQYKMNYQQNEIGEYFAEPIGEQKPLFAIRLFSIGVIVAAAVIGRIIGLSMQKQKRTGGRIGKK